MANTRVYTRSFAGGELSPEMFGRIDDAKFQSGAATMRNFVATPTGAAKNRAGFAYVNATKNNAVARLIPFTFSLNQTMVIEVGAGYFRFHTGGQTLLGANRWYLAIATCSISIGSPCIVSMPGHNFANGDTLVFTAGFGGALPTGLTASTVYYVINSSQSAGTFEVSATSGGSAIATSGTQSGTPSVSGYYHVGDIVQVSRRFGRSQVTVTNYLCLVANWDQSLQNLGGTAYWQQTSATAGTPYEVANPYAAADLFSIHYVQSADVMTLVHPNYPPATLSRISASSWVYAAINFGAPLSTPTGVAVVASPGFLAQIASISGASPALITTVTNHTLALGDGVYAAGLGSAAGFYMVSKVPVDGSGNLIPNELYLMDYSGNAFAYSGSVTGATLQYGTKIFNITNSYAVIAVASDGVSTSLLSASVSILNNLNVPGSYNTITWSAVSGAATYYVYKQLNGLWGLIGSTQALTFADNNIAPDMGLTPGTSYGVFSGAGNYPGAVGYFQQRKCFGGTGNAPQNAWMSNSGTESQFNYSLPSLDTDAVAFRVAAQKADIIQHIIPMMEMILLTSESEYALVPAGSSAITPSSVSVNPQSYIGASSVQPTIINTSMVYAAARGGHVRELGYAWTVNGYMTNDLSLRAAHLFDNLTIVDQTYSKSPWPIVWSVSSNGNLLGFTYIPEEQMGAWHHHDTQGTFQSITCVSEGNEDVLYAVITRTVNEQTVNYVERMATRLFDTLEDAFFVDAGATLNGTITANATITGSLQTTPPSLNGTYALTASLPIFAYPATTDIGNVLVVTGSDGNEYSLTILSETSAMAAVGLPVGPIPAGVLAAATPAAWAYKKVSGMTWLEGCTVAVLADGGVQTQKVVTGGAITLDHAASVIQVGLPYMSDLQTLPAMMQLDGYGQGRMKNINKAWVKVFQSSDILVGPDANHLTEIAQRTTEPWGATPTLQSAELMVMTTPSWQANGQVFIRQANPLPLEVVGLTLEVAIGG